MCCRESGSLQSCTAPALVSCVLPWGAKTGLESVDSNQSLSPSRPSTWICTAHAFAMTITSYRLHAPMRCMVLYSVSLKHKLFLILLFTLMHSPSPFLNIYSVFLLLIHSLSTKVCVSLKVIFVCLYLFDKTCPLCYNTHTHIYSIYLFSLPW